MQLASLVILVVSPIVVASAAKMGTKFEAAFDRQQWLIGRGLESPRAFVRGMASAAWTALRGLAPVPRRRVAPIQPARVPATSPLAASEAAERQRQSWRRRLTEPAQF